MCLFELCVCSCLNFPAGRINTKLSKFLYANSIYMFFVLFRLSDVRWKCFQKLFSEREHCFVNLRPLLRSKNPVNNLRVTIMFADAMAMIGHCFIAMSQQAGWTIDVQSARNYHDRTSLLELLVTSESKCLPSHDRLASAQTLRKPPGSQAARAARQPVSQTATQSHSTNCQTPTTTGGQRQVV